jgi:ethanolamine transporter EutH
VVRSVELELKEIENTLKGRDFSEFLDGLPSKGDMENWLQRQEISADAKAWVAKIMNLSISIGTTIVSVGRKIVSTIIITCQQYPSTTFGVIIGSVLSFLVGSIPVLGLLLGPLLAPVFMAFGIGMGAVSDFQSTLLRHRMSALEAEYSVLKNG